LVAMLGFRASTFALLAMLCLTTSTLVFGGISWSYSFDL
jgi:hypothetical protein